MLSGRGGWSAVGSTTLRRPHSGVRARRVGGCVLGGWVGEPALGGWVGGYGSGGVARVGWGVRG